jgi:hypothetical protein
MRRLLIGMVVTATTALIPMLAFADNQQVAEQIAANLRNSGQMHGYKVGVKFQDGTAWLKGRVANPEQMRLALKLASDTPGVERVENELTISPPDTAAPGPSPLGKVQNALSETLGRLQPTNQVQPASADVPVQSLQQVAGATAPEQFPRMAPSGMRDAQSRAVSRATIAQETAPMLVGPEIPAQRVPSSFAPLPAVATGGEEPTLADRVAPQAMTPVPMAAPQMMAPQRMAAQQMMPQQMPAPTAMAAPRPMPVAYTQAGGPTPAPQAVPNGGPAPGYVTPVNGGPAPARYDQAYMPNHAWPSYASYPNYAGVTYPKQYSPTAWPYIGPFYPYPQVPLGWRKVSLEWHDGWWFLDFDDGSSDGPLSGLFRPCR